MRLIVGLQGLERYKVGERHDYYREECISKAEEVLPGRININSTNLASSVDFTCNVINQCGFPYGSTTNAGCVLVPQWASIGQAVPANVGEALCMGPYGGNTTSCDRTDWRQATVSKLDDKFSSWEEDQYKPALSVLFNIFICTQVANEINARRINDEYDFFSGLGTNAIFLGVLIITMGLQAIIINFLGIFFKVEPLDWKEWLVSLAIGTGAWPLSWLTRFISRNVGCIVRFEAQQPPEIDDPKLVAELMAAGQHVQLAQGNHHDYVAKGNGANGHEEVASLKPSEIEEANGPGKV